MRRLARGIAFLAAVGSAWGQVTQTVAGTVTTIDGQPAANATVILVAVKAAEAPEGYLLAKSQADGAFTIASVPKADYRVCVRSEVSPILDPCVWGESPVRVSVGETAAPPPPRVVVAQGIELALTIDDPGGLLAAFDEKASRRPALSVGVFTPGKMYLRMPLAAASATARQYRILVPAGVAPRMVLSSTSFDFDEVGGGGQRVFRDEKRWRRPQASARSSYDRAPTSDYCGTEHCRIRRSGGDIAVAGRSHSA